MNGARQLSIMLLCLLWCAAGVGAEAPGKGPASQEPSGDELGMARQLGPDTWGRCAAQLTSPGAKSYELSYVRSNTMPISELSGPFEIKYHPPTLLPGTTQGWNFDTLAENTAPGQQGTQMDAFGHFADYEQPWDGSSDSHWEGARYYGGLTQKDVKPTPDSPLLKLGIENVPPIVTTAVMLDARSHVGGGSAMRAGQVVTAEHLDGMLEAQGLADRGILPGDVVFVYTGWSDHYRDPDTEKIYYSMAPGFSYDAAEYLADKRVVAAGLDTPFVDPVNEGQIAGTAGPPEGTPDGKPFAVHYLFLTQAGIHTLENLNLRELAQDRVSTSCAIILPLRKKGGAGSAIRPVAIGVPER